MRYSQQPHKYAYDEELMCDVRYTWYCDLCGAENHVMDASCQFCDAEEDDESTS